MDEATVDAALSGAVPYDQLDAESQVLVRALWETRDAEVLADLDFTRVCPDCGHAYAQESPACQGHTPRH